MLDEPIRIEQQWPAIKQLFRRTFTSSLHYAIASVNENGEPHVSPIGSIILAGPGAALYFEQFTVQLPNNLNGNKNVCILAVNSNYWFWLKALVRGRFPNPPGLRLYGFVGERRRATDAEINLWQKRVRPFKFTKGYRLMWANMRTVRDINFTRAEPIRLGAMTQGLWSAAAERQNEHG